MARQPESAEKPPAPDARPCRPHGRASGLPVPGGLGITCVKSMATLTNDPTKLELEDFIAAHFASRSCYVETGVKERNPDEILELDVVWTNYRSEPPIRHPVEVKSGDWGLGDVFKFYGWSQYLGLEPGEFVFKQPLGRADPSSLQHISKRVGISFVHLEKLDDVEPHFSKLGLPKPAWDGLTELWRFSFWAQRRLLQALGEAIKRGKCASSAKAAKEYYQLINDSVFFIPDVRDRVGELLSAHFDHQKLGATAAYELETGKYEVANPPACSTFKKAHYAGRHFPIQTCLYLGHRARLYILRAVVDYWLARERGEIKSSVINFDGKVVFDVTPGRLSSAMAKGIEELSVAKSLRLFPVFWQVFLWSWGGFLMKDQLPAEYADLEAETGVPQAEIPLALGAFDKLFPIEGGWFRELDSRRVLTLMPQALRGIGAYRRQARRKVGSYTELGYKDETRFRLASDHNCCARLLDSKQAELAD